MKRSYTLPVIVLAVLMVVIVGTWIVGTSLTEQITPTVTGLSVYDPPANAQGVDEPAPDDIDPSAPKIGMTYHAYYYSVAQQLFDYAYIKNLSVDFLRGVSRSEEAEWSTADGVYDYSTMDTMIGRYFNETGFDTIELVLKQAPAWILNSTEYLSQDNENNTNITAYEYAMPNANSDFLIEKFGDALRDLSSHYSTVYPNKTFIYQIGQEWGWYFDTDSDGVYEVFGYDNDSQDKWYEYVLNTSWVDEGLLERIASDNNLLLDPGFEESGWSGWYAYDGSLRIERETSASAHGGSNHSRFNDHNATDTLVGSLWQSVGVTSRRTDHFVFQFWHYAPAASTLNATATFINGSGAVLGSMTQAYGVDNLYDLKTLNFTVPAATATINISFTTGNTLADNSSTQYIDDVRLYNAQVPSDVPSAFNDENNAEYYVVQKFFSDRHSIMINELSKAVHAGDPQALTSSSMITFAKTYRQDTAVGDDISKSFIQISLIPDVDIYGQNIYSEDVSKIEWILDGFSYSLLGKKLGKQIAQWETGSKESDLGAQQFHMGNSVLSIANLGPDFIAMYEWNDEPNRPSAETPWGLVKYTNWSGYPVTLGNFSIKPAYNTFRNIKNVLKRLPIRTPQLDIALIHPMYSSNEDLARILSFATWDTIVKQDGFWREIASRLNYNVVTVTDWDIENDPSILDGFKIVIYPQSGLVMSESAVSAINNYATSGGRVISLSNRNHEKYLKYLNTPTSSFVEQVELAGYFLGAESNWVGGYNVTVSDLFEFQAADVVVGSVPGRFALLSTYSPLANITTLANYSTGEPAIWMRQMGSGVFMHYQFEVALLAYINNVSGMSDLIVQGIRTMMANASMPLPEENQAGVYKFTNETDYGLMSSHTLTDFTFRNLTVSMPAYSVLRTDDDYSLIVGQFTNLTTPGTKVYFSHDNITHMITAAGNRTVYVQDDDSVDTFTDLIELNMSIVPSSDSVNVTIETYTDDNKTWTESSTVPTLNTSHTVGGFAPNQTVQLSINDILRANLTARSLGYVRFNYTDGFSTIRFTLGGSGIPLDSDQDGVADIFDTLEGHEYDVAQSGIGNLIITVDGGTENGSYSGVRDVIFYDGSSRLMNFTHNFSASQINLSRVSIDVTSRSIVVNLDGQLNGEKILYLDDNGFIDLCVKNAEITSVGEITSGCTGPSETDFTTCIGNATGIVLNNISCVDNGTRFIIENLSYSGVTGTLPTSGGGSGRGVRRDVDCAEQWTCTDWGSCLNNNLKTRRCRLLVDCFGVDSERPPESEHCDWIAPEEPATESGAADGSTSSADVVAGAESVLEGPAEQSVEKVIESPVMEAPAETARSYMTQTITSLGILLVIISIILTLWSRNRRKGSIMRKKGSLHVQVLSKKTLKELAAMEKKVEDIFEELRRL